MIRLIALTGPAHCGKNTLCDRIRTQLYQGGLIKYLNTGDDSDIVRTAQYAFARPIKETINKLFGWDERHSEGELKEIVDPTWGFSPRRAYQTFGTDWGRQMLRDDIWLKMAENACKGPDTLVITDLRFENEADWVRNRGGLIVHVRRAGAFGIQSIHASEQGIRIDWTRDFITAECKNVDELRAESAKIVSLILEGREPI